MAMNAVTAVAADERLHRLEAHVRREHEELEGDELLREVLGGGREHPRAGEAPDVARQRSYVAQSMRGREAAEGRRPAGTSGTWMPTRAGMNDLVMLTARAYR
jgi:hypothetical protein